MLTSGRSASVLLPRSPDSLIGRSAPDSHCSSGIREGKSSSLSLTAQSAGQRDRDDRVRSGAWASVSDCVWLLRHGATEWTQRGRHTGREDVPLSDDGREQARKAGSLLAGRRFQHVFVSPQTRARETCSRSKSRSSCAR